MTDIPTLDFFDNLVLNGYELQTPPDLNMTAPPRHRRGEKFLCGPIPWAWLELAGEQPGKSLHVAIILWQAALCHKSGQVRFCYAHGSTLGVEVDAARRGLSALADVDLVTIQHQRGKCSLVTLQEVRHQRLQLI
jgi:hypothetical protein